MAGRPFWSGQIRVSLVAFGVQLFPATSSTSGIAFHQIDKKTGQRIHHLNVVEGSHPVDDADIVKGYEYSKGKYIEIDPAEVKKLRLETQRAIQVKQFVDSKDLPPFLFEKPYFVVPDRKESLEAFNVIRAALAETGKIAIGEVAFSGREHLLAIAPAPDKDGRGMMAYILRYAEELRNSKDFFSDIPEQKIDKQQLSLAHDLIRAQSAPLHLQDYKDDYEAALRQLVEAKRNKTPLPAEREKPAAKVVSLMDALKRSVNETKTAEHPKKRATHSAAKHGPTLVKSGKRSRNAA